MVTEDAQCKLRFKTTSTIASTPSKSEAQSRSPSAKKQSEEQDEKPKDDDTSPTPRADEGKDEAEEEKEVTKPTVVDPIRMFGILVPPALRTAQASFREAVDGPVVSLAGVTGELRALEREIGRTRKSIRKA